MSWASYSNYTAHGQKGLPIISNTLIGKKMTPTPNGIVSETIAGHFKPLGNIVEKTVPKGKPSATDMLDFHHVREKPRAVATRTSE